MNPRKQPEFLNLRDLFIKYVKYWKWFLISIFLTSFLAVIYVKMVTPVYNVTANIKLREEKSGSSQMSSSIAKSIGFGMLGGGSNVIEDESLVLGSQTNMRKMIYDLGLYTTYTLKQFPFDKSLYNTSPVILEASSNVVDTLSSFIEFKVSVKNNEIFEVEAQVGDDKIFSSEFQSLPAIINTSYGEFVLKSTGKRIKNGSDYNLNITLFGLDFAAESYRQKVAISPASKKSEMINLSLDETDRQRGKDILNKLIGLYNEDALYEKREMSQNMIEFVNSRIAHIAIEVDSLERNIERFKKQNKLADIQAESKIFAEQYSTMQEKSIGMDVQLDIANLLEKYISNPENKYKLIPINLQTSTTSIEPITVYNEAILERSRLLRNSNESNPVFSMLDERIDALRDNVKTSIQNMRRDIRIQHDYWKKFQNEMIGKLANMPKQEREFIDIERQRLVKSELYVFLLTKKEETQLMAAAEVPKAKVINEAFNFWKPIYPKKSLILLIAMIIGFVIPILIIYIKDLFKFKVASKEELESLTYLPVLGEVCLLKNSNLIAVKDGVDTSIAELFRLIRANLQFLLKKDQKVILVTSSISGEGKSFFTLNLALSFSLMKNKKVVLVGLDIRSPKLAEYLSIKSRNGITMYMASDDMKPEDVIIHKSDIHPNFYVVPAGPIPPNPSELLLSDRIEEFFDYLRANFDYIIVDSAPVGMVSDTFVLDRISDKTVYLFRANYTNKSYLKFAESIEQAHKLKDLSVVINGTNTKSAYGYGYSKKD